MKAYVSTLSLNDRMDAYLGTSCFGDQLERLKRRLDLGREVEGLLVEDFTRSSLLDGESKAHVMLLFAFRVFEQIPVLVCIAYQQRALAAMCIFGSPRN